MCFPTAPKATPAPPPPADLAPIAPKIGDEGESSRSTYNRKKKGTSSLRIERQVGGTSPSGTNIPTK
jgi:hypothetical protein